MTVRTTLAMAAVALTSSAATLLLDSVLRPYPVVAQQQEQQGPAEGLTLYAYHRRASHVKQGFIFYNVRTGDIWVYDDKNAKEHYRVTEMGQDMEKL